MGRFGSCKRAVSNRQLRFAVLDPGGLGPAGAGEAILRSESALYRRPNVNLESGAELELGHSSRSVY